MHAILLFSSDMMNDGFILCRFQFFGKGVGEGEHVASEQSQTTEFGIHAVSFTYISVFHEVYILDRIHRHKLGKMYGMC